MGQLDKKENYKNGEKSNKKVSNNKNKSRKNGKYNPRFNGKDETVSSTQGNDVKWYLSNPELVRGAAKVNYSYPLGSILKVYEANSAANYITDEDAATQWMQNRASIPGIMTINWVPSFGRMNAPIDALSNTARNIYSFIRSFNSGKTNYQSTDLMIYILAVSNAYNYWYALQRVYGSLNSYSVWNRYIAQALVNAMGFDYDDLVANKERLRNYVNAFAVKLGRFPIPASMSYYIRQNWLNLNVFSDANNPKPQLYVFKQTVYPVFENDVVTKLGQLVYRRVPNKMKIDQLIDFGDKLLDPILWDEDCATMGGDILKAFGDNVLKVYPLPIDYTTNVNYQPEVLEQIQNSEAWGKIQDDTVFVSQVIDDLTADTYLKSQTTLAAQTEYTDNFYKLNLSMQPKILSTLIPNPNEDVSIILTRLKSCFDVGGTTPEGQKIYEVSNVGSEYIEGYTIYHYTKIPGQTILVCQTDTFTSAGELYTDSANYNLSPQLGNLNIIAMLDNFDYHPAFTLVYTVKENTTESSAVTKPFMDIDMYGIIHPDDLKALNDNVLFNMLEVPLTVTRFSAI